MRAMDFFHDNYIMGDDIAQFMNVLKLFDQRYGKEKCWCIKKINNPEHLKGFVLSHPNRPVYKGTDARGLVLALIDQYSEPEKPFIVRYSNCLSTHCINPNHYFHGTKRDVAIQRNKRNGTHRLDPGLIELLRHERSEKRSYASLAREFNLPYHTVRRACLNELPQ
jgi:hypothetical protein